MRQRVRALLATPRFTIVALLTIILLVCGITTIFSVVNGVVLRALPYPSADRLVVIQAVDPRGSGRAVMRPDFERLASTSQSFDRWAGYRLAFVRPLADQSGEPKQVHEIAVAGDAFRTLGFDVVRGRALNAVERESVAVIDDAVWDTLFQRREDVVGRVVTIGKESVTIVGVLQKGEDVPLNWLTRPTIYRPVEWSNDPNALLTTVARLKAGINLEQARAELSTMSFTMPSGLSDGKARLTPLFDAIVGDSARLAWLFFAVAAVVVLIGIGNLTSLQMARNSERRREVMVRFALGASRPRLIHQLVAETVMVGAIGGIAGLALAAPMIRMLIQNLPARFPRADQIGIDINVAAFAIGVAVSATLIIGFIGAWTITSAETTSHLTDAAIKGASRPLLQGTLIGAQTAAALILLVGTGLLLGSLVRLINRDAGMREDGLWMAIASLPRPRYQAEAQSEQFWNDAMALIKRTPSVEAAALMVNGAGPLAGGDLRTSVLPAGSTVDPRSAPSISYRRVSANYLATVGMPIKRGRDFVPADGPDGERVAIINDLAAAMLWPGEDAIGKRFRTREELVTVVGVVGDYRHMLLEGDAVPQIYLPQDQGRGIGSAATIMFRASNRQAVADVQALLSAKEKEMTVRISSMADQRWLLTTLERFRIVVLSAFALTAVALAIVGVAGLVGYTVAQRTREVAIRIALGAAQFDILRVTTIQTLLPAAIGIVIGIAGAIAATRLIKSYLVDMTALDPPTYVAAIVAMAIAVITASLVPARRATRIDPAAALRRD